ncbi:MAG: class I SAM-dependent methyltransferase [Ilumatobacteraceae bacterium]
MVANEQQIEHWSGKGGAHWAAEQERYDRTLAPYTDHIMRAVGAAPGEQILDVGCGNGAVSLSLARTVRPGGRVVGVDIATPMIIRARERAIAEDLHHLTFIEADAQTHSFDPNFDGVVSRFGVMFFDDPVAAFANVAGSLRSGGRLAFACWRDLLINEWIMVPASAALQHVPMPDLGTPGAPGPFSLSDPDRILSVLEKAGFTEITMTDIDEPQWLGDDLDGALAFLQRSDMADTLLAGANLRTLKRVWESVREALAPYVQADGVWLGSAAWLVKAKRP